MPEPDIRLSRVRYKPLLHNRQTKTQRSLSIIGIDTETLTTGKCFMISTSEGDTFKAEDYPRCLFSRKYRGANFVAYNLKFDSGSFLQHLPSSHLTELQTNGETIHDGYKYTVIGNKCLSIRRDKNTIHFYDVLNFYNMSLDNAAKKYLGKAKLDMETYSFTDEYVSKHWDHISKYCVQDAILARDLMLLMIKQFEDFGVYPRKLYSVAYISWEYFRKQCTYVHVKDYFDNTPIVLDYAMQSYNGGKFEVTRKGCGKFYSYDIVSAYPYEMANLVNILGARVVLKKTIEPDAAYGFLDCTMNIPYEIFSPIAVKRDGVNCYPVGRFRKVITLNEYHYLKRYGCDVHIHNGVYLIPTEHTYPYRDKILELMKRKDYYKSIGDKAKYQTVKILLNSFYGKMCQLIFKDGYYKAGSAWNPIYASVITANTRIRISEMQQQHESVVAVHTDSIISTEPLPFKDHGSLGDMVSEKQGYGVILGSGIYQIGKHSKFRGFDSKVMLVDMIPDSGKYVDISKHRPYSWREVAHRKLSPSLINRFADMERRLDINFDNKRIWLDDYKCFSEVSRRTVDSVPWALLE